MDENIDYTLISYIQGVYPNTVGQPILENFRILENGDNRIIETGEQRIIE